jgi:hypothetical protein
MLPGRLLLADRREFACTIVDVSLNGVGLLARERGAIGDTVVVYAGEYGRIEGRVVRHFDGGFAIKLNGVSRAAEALSKRFEPA